MSTQRAGSSIGGSCAQIRRLGSEGPPILVIVALQHRKPRAVIGEIAGKRIGRRLRSATNGRSRGLSGKSELSSCRPMPHALAEHRADRPGIRVVAVSRDPVRHDARHRLCQSKESLGGGEVNQGAVTLLLRDRGTSNVRSSSPAAWTAMLR